ncbi:trinucleotide repeat containing adaptor protein gawky isoform X1 [Amblyomma americanum]
MQGDDKRNDLFLGQGGPGTWDTRPSSEPREAGNVSAAWPTGTTLTQPSCRNPCERGMGPVEDIVWSGEDASVIHRSSSLGGQCASTGSSNSQPGPRHNRGTSAAPSSSSWPSNDSPSEGADQLLGAVGGTEESSSQSSSQPPQPSRNCRPPRLGLLGGGENSHNNGTTATGWGAPPPGPQGGWGSGGGAQWGGATARSADYTPGGPNPSGDAGGASSPTKPAAAGSWGQGAVSKVAEAPDAKSATTGPRSVLEEPMTELRRLAAFSEGWGQTSINQDTPWEMPQSPGTKEPPTGAPWRAPVNTGTEIWENNLRSARAGGNKQPNPPQAAQGSSQCPQQQPWGSHTPTSHIGGTWGEEDEVPSSNMWTGVPAPAQQGGPRPPPEGPPSWGGDHHRGGGEKHWGGPAPPPPNSGWGAQEERESQGRLWGGRPSHSMDDGPSGAWGGGPKGAGPPPGVGTWSPVGGPNGKREPSGWEEPSPPPSRRPVTNYDDGTALWGNPTRQGKVGSARAMHVPQVSHWKDMPSVKSISGGGGGGAPPGMLRMPKEGVWGGNKGPRGGGANWGDSGWDDHNKGAWGGVPPEQAYWGSKPKGPPSWADGQIDTSTWGGPSKQGGKPLTKDLIYASKQFRLLTEMGFKKEDVENALRSNQMNLEDTLMDLKTLPRGNGAQDSGLLDGSDCGLGGIRPKMRSDEDPHGPLGEAPFAGFHPAAAGFQGLPVFGAGYGGGQGFKPPPVKGSNQGSNAPASLLNSTGMGGQNSSLTVGNSISSLSPALVQKILQQQQQQQQQHFPANAGCPAGMGARLGQPNVPSATQLRLLVQQIQMAVHAGHLNPQILNQPLAPQTLQLLYQLLQQIKVLHQLQQQQQLVHTKGGPPLQLNVQLTQTKQRILNLQNQIAAQQALFLKQQLPPPPPPQPPQQQAPPHAAPPPPAGLGGGPSTPQDFLGSKPGGAEGLHSDFRDLNLKDAVSQQQQQQSRLNQWKLPSSLDEDNKAPQQNGGGDFSRAPGPASKAGSGLSSFLGGTDGPWSTGACSQDGWPDAPPTTSGASGGTSSPGEAKDSNAAGYSLSDLVAEFEPGKPWKGASALKSAEDDPHLTPGSVVRSPLSVNTIKDSELFGSWKPSPPGGEGSLVASLASLTSSTWAFTPAIHGSGNGSGGSSKGNASKSGWGGSSEQAPSSDPWNVGPKTRGPPPGLSSGWEQQGSTNCTFLVLKNLTPQIDGSTLKTLCMQHGPLQLFHLFLKHGLALAQYGSREEAAKAQSALHNCVLSNTTMLAYIPSESEVAQFLQLANGQGQHPSQQPPPQHQMPWGSSTSAFHPPQRPPLQQFAPGPRVAKQPGEPWNTPQPPASSAAAAVSSSTSNASHLWSFPGAGGGLWSAPQTSQAGGGGSNPTGLDHDHGAPGGPQSSLNSFLPGDLLSGESM